MTPDSEILTVWLFLASLAGMTVLLIKCTSRMPVATPDERLPLDLQDQLTSRIVKLERLIADSQLQLTRTQELISQLDQAA